MKTFKDIILGFLIMGMSASNAQLQVSLNKLDVEEGKNDYFKELVSLGFSDNEIFEDLGNAYFLMERYNEAVFWYGKLFNTLDSKPVTEGVKKRYKYALVYEGKEYFVKDVKSIEWQSNEAKEYVVRNYPSDPEQKIKPELSGQIETTPFTDPRLYEKINFLLENNQENLKDFEKSEQLHYKSPVAVTPDGMTAFFCMGKLIKPKYGILSNKKLVYSIFKLEKLDGKWGALKELNLTTKYYSAMHPSISPKGNRLFFASDMPGSFGKYDIYLSELKRDGSIGIAKNLGRKVNTKENDLYPKLMGKGLLFFASDGHRGFGGLDMFMVRVVHNDIGPTINIGQSINSLNDEFSICLAGKNGMGYILSVQTNDLKLVSKRIFQYEDFQTHRFIDNDLLGHDLENKTFVDFSSNNFED